MPSLLTELPTLPSVRSIAWTWSNSDERKELEDLERFVKLLPNLERLKMEHARVKSTVPLGRLKELTELDLFDVDSQKPSTLDFLPSLPKLRSLGLREIPASVRGNKPVAPGHQLDVLPKLLGLERLDLSGVELSDLSPLASMPKLAEVLVANTAVTDVSPLEKLPLRFLDIEGLKIDAKSIAPFAKIKDLQVAFKGRRWLSAERLHSFLEGKYKLPTLKDTVRPAFLLKTKAGDPGPFGSSFGGTPYLAAGEEWPTCKKCTAAMPLIAQVDLGRRSQAPNKGTLQVFYCTTQRGDDLSLRLSKRVDELRHDDAMLNDWVSTTSASDLSGLSLITDR